MEIPPDNGGIAHQMDAEGFSGDPGFRMLDVGTHLAVVHRDAEMEPRDADDAILERMHALLSNTRSQLTRAVEEANQLQAWSSDEVSKIGGLLRIYNEPETTMLY